MGSVENKFLIYDVEIEKVLNHTHLTKYTNVLKKNGILSIRDVNIMRNNSRLGKILNECIENEDDVILLMEIFDKKIENIYGLYCVIVLFIVVGWFYYCYHIGLLDLIF